MLLRMILSFLSNIISGSVAGALLFACASLVQPINVYADAASPNIENPVKAAFVFNFLAFVSWPENALAQAEIGICLVGPDIYGNALQIFDGQVVQGKRVRVIVRGEWSPESLRSCPVVLFTLRDPDEVGRYLASLAMQPILTIGDSTGFLEKHGIIQLVRIDDKIGFEVNLVQANLSRLTLSAKLLRLARRVIT